MQAFVVNVYKGLLAQQSHLHIKLSGVKSSVFKPPLPNIELEAALNVAVQSQLTQHGWSQLDRQQLVTGNVWGQQASGQQACYSVKLSLICHAPGYVWMRMQTGAPASLAFSSPELFVLELTQAAEDAFAVVPVQHALANMPSEPSVVQSMLAQCWHSKVPNLEMPYRTR